MNVDSSSKVMLSSSSCVGMLVAEKIARSRPRLKGSIFEAEQDGWCPTLSLYICNSERRPLIRSGVVGACCTHRGDESEFIDHNRHYVEPRSFMRMNPSTCSCIQCSTHTSCSKGVILLVGNCHMNTRVFVVPLKLRRQSTKNSIRRPMIIPARDTGVLTGVKRRWTNLR